MSLVDYASSELARISVTRTTRDKVLTLMAEFEDEGHSGASAAGALAADKRRGRAYQLFRQLARFEPLTPLTGKKDEWMDFDGKGLFQNIRCPVVFKEGRRAYDIAAAPLHIDERGGYYTNSDEVPTIRFPYDVAAARAARPVIRHKATTDRSRGRGRKASAR